MYSLQFLIFLSLIYALLVLMVNHVSAELENKEWTDWTTCSKTCNTGIQFRTRNCSEMETHCSVSENQVRVCNQQDCDGKVINARDQQCRKFNKEVISRRRYHWSGYIIDSKPCQLYCKASYYGFYRKFDENVEDGTECKDRSGKGICVDGQCKQIGCDGIVGSDGKFDQCGVCRGDSSTCQIISGIFTRRYLSYGYNLISRIPEGACNINITEMGRSRNYLALKLTNGNYIFNGNYRLSRNNRFTEAGTTFQYHRHKRSEECPAQCIKAKGPTTKSIDLELLFYQMNPGIMYQFTVPNNLTDYFIRNMIPNLRSDPRRQTLQQSRDRGTLSNSQKDVYMITNPNAVNSLKSRTRTSSRNQLNSQPAVQSRPSYGNSYKTSSADRSDSDTRHRQNVYTYPGVSDSNKQAATGDYGQQSSGNTIPTEKNSLNYGNRNGYPVYSNGIPLGGTSNRNGIPLGGTINRNGIPLGGTISSNGVPLGGTLNKPPLLIANNIPDSKNYFWRISGFTECSRTCGGGVQETQIVCLKKDTNVMVTNENCDPRLKPQSQVLKCNSNICPPNWASGNWSECSTTCGQGMQTRPVLCKQLIDSELHLEVPISRCDSRTRPESARSCLTRACAEWETGEWGKCSVNCGRGMQKREVYCKHVEGTNTTETECEGRKPESRKSCDMGVCAVGWFYSKWSRRCSSSCGSGYVTRKVFCSAADGTPLPEIKCSKRSKPKQKRPCRNKIPCGGIWFEGPWSKCSATCGKGVKKRDVICMKKLGEKLITVVEEENCALKAKPPVTKACKSLPPCKAEWFMTSWTKCSKTCDAGTKSRLIKCLDEELRPSSTCNADLRPTTRHVCNTDSCDIPQLDEDPHCTDKLKNCQLVGQARLCKYPFYKETCCRSCKKHEHRTHRNRRRL